MLRLRALAIAVLLCGSAAALSAQSAGRLSTADSTRVARLTSQSEAAVQAQDFPEALRLSTEIATILGNADVLHQLGHMFEGGSPRVERDEAEAVRVFTLSAELGHREAQHHIGVRLLEGRGVQPDRFGGIRLLERSARQHYAPAVAALEQIAAAASAATACSERELKRLGYVELGGDPEDAITGGNRTRYVNIRQQSASLAQLRGDVVTVQGPSDFARHQFALTDESGFVGITESTIQGTGVKRRSLMRQVALSPAGAREIESVRTTCAPR
jgi:TPR repeat protein